MKRSNKGFTLIELLVVIAIIGTLASVVLASLNTARVKARDSARVSQIEEVKKALEIYFLDNGSYPDDGVAGGTTFNATGGLVDTLSPKYMPSLPSDPKGVEYIYVNRTDGSGYGIRIQFEDTDRPGTDSLGRCKTGVNILNGWWGAGTPECQGI